MGKVLIVDDEPLSAKVLELFLTERGHDTRVAGSGREAQELGESFRPDVLITDYLLPDEVHGDQVIAQLSRTRPDLVSFVVSGLPPEEVRPRIEGLPRTSLLTKPVDLDVLVEQVAERLEPVSRTPSGPWA
jgi:CheY-like chemotaxis protein